MILTFNKENREWFVVLPEWTGDKSELQMVVGADTMLDHIAKDNTSVTLRIDENPFDGADVLKLIEPETEMGGGWYWLKSYQRVGVNISMWLCHVTEFVFGKLPEKIYIAHIEG